MDTLKININFFFFKRFNKVATFFYNRYTQLLHEQQQRKRRGLRK